MFIRPEKSFDRDAIRRINDVAFGRLDEGRLIDALRDEGYARLSLIAEDNGEIVGHILFSELRIESKHETILALALAPMAVVPSQQRKGIGTKLVREGLRLSKESSYQVVVVLGDVDYYTRFGFTPELAQSLQCEYSGPALMALELVPGSLSGASCDLKYAPPFQRL